MAGPPSRIVIDSLTIAQLAQTTQGQRFLATKEEDREKFIADARIEQTRLEEERKVAIAEAGFISEAHLAGQVPEPIDFLPDEDRADPLSSLARRDIQLQREIEARGLHFLSRGTDDLSKKIEIMEQVLGAQQVKASGEDFFTTGRVDPIATTADAAKLPLAYMIAALTVSSGGAITTRGLGKLSTKILSVLGRGVSKETAKVLATGAVRTGLKAKAAGLATTVAPFAIPGLLAGEALQEEIAEPGAAVALTTWAAIDRGVDKIIPDFDKIPIAKKVPVIRSLGKSTPATDVVSAFFPGFRDSQKELWDNFGEQMKENGFSTFLTLPSNWITTQAYAETDYPKYVKGTSELIFDPINLVLGSGTASQRIVSLIRKADKAATLGLGGATFRKGYTLGKFVKNNDINTLISVGQAKWHAGLGRMTFDPSLLKPSMIGQMTRRLGTGVKHQFRPHTTGEAIEAGHVPKQLTLLKDEAAALRTEVPAGGLEIGDTGHLMLKTPHVANAEFASTIGTRATKATQRTLISDWGPEGAVKTQHSLLQDSAPLMASAQVEHANTRFGVDVALNTWKLTMDETAHRAAITSELGTPWSKAIQLVARVPYVGGFRRMVRERFSNEMQVINTRHYSYSSGWLRAIDDVSVDLARRFRDGFGNPNAPRSWKDVGILKATASKRAIEYSTRLDGEVVGKLKTENQRKLSLVIDMIEHPNDYVLSPLQESFINETQQVFRDDFDHIRALLFRKGIGGDKPFDLATAVEGNYFPHVLERVDGGVDPLLLLDELGTTKYREGAIEKLFNVHRKEGALTEERTFASIRDGVLSNTEYRLAHDIENPIQLIAMRLSASQRMGTDRLLDNLTSKYLSDQGALGKVAFENAKGEIGDLKGVLRGDMSRVINAISKIPAIPRMIKFSGDLGIFGVQAAFGLQYALVNPAKTLKAYTTAFRVMLSDVAYQDYKVFNSTRFTNAQRDGVTFAGQVLERDIGGSFIEKGSMGIRGLDKFTSTGRIYNPVKYVNDLQFNRLMSVLKLEFYEMNQQLLYKHSPINQMWRSAGNLGFKANQMNSEREAGRAAAAHVNELFGGTGNLRALQSKNMRGLASWLLMTPDFAQATAAMALRPIGGGFSAEAQLARGFWLRLMIMTGLAGATVQEMIAPQFDFNFTDPTKADWMLIRGTAGEGGIGDSFNILGRFRGFARTVLAVPADLIDATGQVGGSLGILPEDRGFPTNRKGKVDLTRLNIVKRAVGSNGQSGLLGGRFSIPLRTAIDWADQKDFLGRPTVRPGDNFFTQLQYATENVLAPISLEQYFEDRRRNQLTAASIWSYIFGNSQFPYEQIQEDIKEGMIPEIAQQLFDGDEFPDMTGEELEKLVRAHVEDFKPFEILVPGTDRAASIDKQKVYQAVGIRYDIKDINGKVDIGRVARFGTVEEPTKRQRENEQEAYKKQYFAGLDDLDLQKEAALVEVAENYGIGERYQTSKELFEVFADIDSTISERRRGLYTPDVEEALEALGNERLDPSTRTVMIETIINIIDDTTNPDGSKNYWARQRALDEIEAQAPDIVAAFFDGNDNLKVTPEYRLYKYMQSFVQDYYATPARLLDEKPFNLWRRLDRLNTNDEKVRFLLTLTPQERTTVIVADRNIRIQQVKFLLEHPDGAEMELALFLVQGKVPITPAGKQLLLPLLAETPTDLTGRGVLEQSTDLLLETFGKDLTK